MTTSTSRKRGGQFKPPLDDAKLRELYISCGLDGFSVAREMGVCHQRVYKRLKELGIIKTSGPKHLRAELNPNWGGGRQVSVSGYVRVRRNNRYEYEHRIVAEKTLARDLKGGEVVHHLNGDMADNRPENIEVFQSHSEHMQLHLSSEKAREMQKQSVAKRQLILKLKEETE